MGVDAMPSLEALLVQADFVSIHLPLTPETEGLIGEHELRLMKQGARLINTARGGIVDEEALAKAIEDGHLGGAALDVFAAEPMTDSPLFGLASVVVTPHLGASTKEAQDKAGTTVADMVRLALTGEFVASRPRRPRSPRSSGRSCRSPSGSGRSRRDSPREACVRSWRPTSVASRNPIRGC